MTLVRRLACAALAGLCGCSAPSQPEHGARVRASIIEGELSGPSEDGVVLLRAHPPDAHEVICSASLVAPNLLLTARHCVSYLQDGLFSCSVQGELVNNPDGAGRVGRHFEPGSIEVYGGAAPRAEPLARGAQVLSTLSETICVNDLAFVVLDTALELPRLPLRLGRPAEVGERAVLLGFGLDESEEQLDFRAQPRRRKPGLVIAGVGPDSLADGVTTVPPRTIILQGPSGCIGDSGGPLLDEASGAVLGVYSLQEGDSCTRPEVRNALVHLPPFELLLEQAFAAAGAEPLLEADRDEPAAGAAGETGAPPDPEMAAGAGGAPGEREPSASSSARDDSSCAVRSAPGAGAGPAACLVLAALATSVQRVRRRGRRGGLGRLRSGRRRAR